MSEYQYYEFLALDQPLTDRQMKEVRRFSTRARITPTSFVNEYNWGDFRGDVSAFMTKYYDAFVYVANWGTHELSFRLPRVGFDVSMAKRYCAGDLAQVRLRGECAVLSMCSENEVGGDWEEGEDWMSSLSPLRGDLLAGDWRSLYLGWLNCVACEEVEEDEIEPPVPPGLGDLTAPLRALADFLRIDPTLVEVCAKSSAPLMTQGNSSTELRAWIEGLSVAEKDVLLYRLAQESPTGTQREILRRFRQARGSRPPESKPSGQTVGQLLEAWKLQMREKERRAAAKEAREKARRQAEEAKARQRRLDELSKREAQAWQQVNTLIHTRQPKSYDEAVGLLRDLSDLAEREGRPDDSIARVKALRDAHRNKPSLLRRLDEAKL